MKLKIGRHTQEIESGDYIFFNGAIHIFCTGDSRDLVGSADGIFMVRVPKVRMKDIPFGEMEYRQNRRGYLDLKCWFFDARHESRDSADFLKVRDLVQRLLKESGAFMMGNVIHDIHNDSWVTVAAIDRLVELKEIKEITKGVVEYYRIFSA